MADKKIELKEENMEGVAGGLGVNTTVKTGVETKSEKNTDSTKTTKNVNSTTNTESNNVSNTVDGKSNKSIQQGKTNNMNNSQIHMGNSISQVNNVRNNKGNVKVDKSVVIENAGSGNVYHL